MDQCTQCRGRQVAMTSIVIRDPEPPEPDKEVDISVIVATVATEFEEIALQDEMERSGAPFQSPEGFFPLPAGPKLTNNV